jgi:hypothetical protein
MHSTSSRTQNLRRLEGGGEAADVLGEVALVAEELNVSTVNLDLAGLALLNVLVTLEGSEAPVLGDNDLLATGELFRISTANAKIAILRVRHTLYWQRLRASRAVARCESLVRTDMRIWPMFTRATRPLGLPKAPRIPVCNLSAPAHDNILLIRTTW